jgi:hypothetical protein
MLRSIYNQKKVGISLDSNLSFRYLNAGFISSKAAGQNQGPQISATLFTAQCCHG